MSLIPSFDSFGEFISTLNAESDSFKSNFSFNVSASHLEIALQKAVVATAYDSSSSIKHHLIVVENSEVSVVGFTNEIFVEIRVQGVNTVQGSGYVSINSAVLQGLIKNRNDLNISFNSESTKRLLNFKALKGVYKGELAVMNVEDHLLPLVNDKITSFDIKTPLRKDLFSAIVDGVKTSQIKNIYNTNQAILTYVTYSAKTGNVRVFSYDNWHLAMFSTTVTLPNTDAGDGSTGVIPDKSFSLSFSTSLFDMLEKVSGGNYGVPSNNQPKTSKKTKAASTATAMSSALEDYFGFGLINNALALSGYGFRILVPYVQANKKDFESPINVIKSLPQPVAMFEFNDRLLTSASNLYALTTVKGLQYSLNVSKNKGVYLSIKTNSGDASDKIPVKNLTFGENKDDETIAINFDPDIFKDLIKPLLKIDMSSATADFNLYDNCYKMVYNHKLPSKVVESEDADDDDNGADATANKSKTKAYTVTLLGSIFNEGGS